MHSFAWWPTLIVLAVATFTDLRSRRIPNWLVLPFLLAGVGVSGWMYGWHGLGQSCAGLGLGLLIYGALFWIGGMGAGDVKLCAAIGAWIWPRQLLFALVATSMAGGILILGWLFFGIYCRRLLVRTGERFWGWKRLAMPSAGSPEATPFLKRKVPYAPAMAIGTLYSFFLIPR